MPAIGVVRPTRVGDVIEYEAFSEYGHCRKIIRAVTPSVDYTIGQVVKPDGTAWTPLLITPVQAAATTSTTGGTLAAATYFYVVTAFNASGESLASNEVSIATTGTTSSNTVNWASVANATGYRVYRGTAAGVENVYYTVGLVVSFVDTGAANTAGSPPTTNKSGSAFGGVFIGTVDDKNVAVAGTAADIVVLYRGNAGIGNGYLKPAATAAAFKEMQGLIDAAGIKILEQPVNAMNTTTPASVGVVIPTV